MKIKQSSKSQHLHSSAVEIALALCATTMRVAAVSLLVFTSFLSLTFAADDDHPLDIDIAHTSIEKLLTMNITSVSKAEESFIHSPAAVYVLTNEMIRRSGAMSIPEALRLVPGVQVARIDANKWSVSVRGFNSRTANKLLVLIDGRSVYDPLFSGVLWESKDVMLEDVERIEVQRGPGGSLWGANAVNGVINIITKSAKDTQGGLVTGGGGTEERGFGNARYGVKVGEEEYLRVYGKGYARDSGIVDGHSADDDSDFAQGGFRFDSKLNDSDNVTFQGDIYDGTQGNPDKMLVRDQKVSGQNLLLKWNRKLSSDSGVSLLTYYDRTELDMLVVGEERDTGFVELQYELSPWSGHRLVVGANYNITSDEEESTALIGVEPNERTDETISAYFEDKIDLIPEALFLTVGSKFSENDYTGFEVQPTTRLSWTPTTDNLLWAAVSRAVRVPSRLEEDARVSAGGVTFTGNRDLDAENVIAYEIGYRTVMTKDLFVDIATFVNDYDQLVDNGGLTFRNRGEGQTYGVETVLTWQAQEDWRLEAAYTIFQMDLSINSDDPNEIAIVNRIQDNDPANQVSLSSRLNIGADWNFDTNLRYVDNLPALGVKSYIVADVGLTYFVRRDLELSIVGQNLFDKQHFEQSSTSGTEVQQGVYGLVRCRF